MLSAHQMLHLDLNLFHALQELNADVEIPSWNAHHLDQLPHALILLTINHTPLELPLEPPELLEIPQFLLTNHLTKMLFADHTDGIVLTSLKVMLLTHVLITLAEM